MPRHPTDRASLEAVCLVEHIRDGGPGGQHRNKRFTGIRLVHEPSGIMVMATERRSPHQNLELAYERIAQRLDELQKPRKKRRPTRPTRGSVKRRLDAKRKTSEKKQGRKTPPSD
jgi:protein subunit release factor B